MGQSLDFRDLVSAITKPSIRPAGAHLRLGDAPNPFVAPPIAVRRTDSSSAPIAVEVVFLEAPAAVGKSTVAQQLSAERNVPVLNLAKVRVSTGALAGIIAAEFSKNATAAQAAFHSGQLPILIDALDEGRMFSGEQHIEEFLETAFGFLLQDRSATTSPKLIFLGRPEAQALAMTALELYGSGIRSAHLEIGYFDEDAARKLIDLNARLVAKPGSAYLGNPAAVQDVIDAYFGAIEGALGISKGGLWSDGTGRAFAGYAPVLGALGHLLANVTNFAKVSTNLRSAGTQEAWQVIETVVQTILEREQVEKFRPALTEQIARNPPDEAYDPAEQLRFLACHIDGQQLTSSGRVGLAGRDLVTYLSMVQRQILDHAFVRQGRLPNAVLASLVLVDGVLHDRFRGSGLSLLDAEARQPFLWQAMRRRLEGTRRVVDGRYVGPLLNSFWSDPLIQRPAVHLTSTGQGQTRVVVTDAARRTEFDATLPITFLGAVRDIEARVEGTVRFNGHAAGGAGSTFRVYGSRTTIVAEEVEVAAENVVLEGAVWLEAATISGSPRVDVVVKKDAKVGWGGAFAKTYPWSAHQPTLAPPPGPPGSRLAELLGECRVRFPAGQGIILYEDHTPAEDDPHTTWARAYAPDFATVVSLLVSHGLASETYLSARGAKRKVKLTLTTTWADLEAAYLNPGSGSAAIRAWADEARAKIG